MFLDDQLQPISALQHLQFCERQWALIHLEGVWTENRFTAEGKVLHDRAHSSDVECRPGVRIARGLRLRSLKYGLIGAADVVEFQQVEGNERAETPAGAVRLERAKGWWRPYPVEYKRGKPKIDRCDDVQLCAQTLCLEEMLGTSIEIGAFYYGQPRRRHEIAIDEQLRTETSRLIERLHALVAAGETPVARYDARCRSCSLIDVCAPKRMSRGSQVGPWLQTMLGEVIKGS